MKRKIVRQGGSALTITLPSKWTQQFRLQPGDEVHIQQHGKDLLLSTTQLDAQKSVELDTIKLGSFHHYYLTYYYHLGYDEIRVVYNKPEVFQQAKEHIQHLLGYEITETGKNSFVIRNVSTVVASEFDTMLRRVFLLTLSIADESLDAFHHNNMAHLHDLQEIELTNNKFVSFCTQVLHKHGHPIPHHTLSMYALVRELEKLCDEYKHLCGIGISRLSRSSTEQFPPQLLEYYQAVNSYVRLFYDLFYVYTEEKVQRLFSEKKRLEEQGKSFLETQQQSQDALLVHHLLIIVSQVFDLKGPYFQMLLSKP
ncbi:AbrB/MazE/SpoVT family DNA-binding domain-containing protein [Candidatus Woesearchaeota archaeon]|nr:AbrB/MazE/SpoVT family DNA-binding domain-containing protein [Candidatus Woesearchaeota archaeon]